MASLLLSIILSLATALHNQIGGMEAAVVSGVCYGMNGNNLPSPADVIAIYHTHAINQMRLFDPNKVVLQALSKSQIRVSLGILNEDIVKIAESLEVAKVWFSANVEPYLDTVDFQYISVGNEVIPGKFADSVTPAMQNLQIILDAKGLGGIFITTAVSMSTLGNSYPPSAGVFSDAAIGPMTDVLKFLSKYGSPLMVNVYPYFAYASDPANIRLDYAQFTAPEPVVVDGDLSYQNLFDAMVDAVFWAMEKVGVADVDVVVSETGWPTAGNGNFTTPELALTYNRNFIYHIASNGTPKRPGTHIEGFLYELFNENLKPAGIEQNFGIFDAFGKPVYPIFTPTTD